MTFSTQFNACLGVDDYISLPSVIEIQQRLPNHRREHRVDEVAQPYFRLPIHRIELNIKRDP
jgi:hypothetical protein